MLTSPGTVKASNAWHVFVREPLGGFGRGNQLLRLGVNCCMFHEAFESIIRIYLSEPGQIIGKPVWRWRLSWVRT